MTRLQPLGDRVVVRRLESEKVSPGGIVIPESAAEKQSSGEVLAVADGPRALAVGDTVLFAKYAGTEVKVDGESVLVLNVEDVLARLKP